MVADAQPSSASSSDDVEAATPDRVEATTTTHASGADIPASTHRVASSSSAGSNGDVPVDDSNLFALLLLQSLDVPVAAHNVVDDVDDAVNEKRAASSNKDDNGVVASSAIIRPQAITGFRNHTMMKEHAAWDDDSSIPAPPPATEIHCGHDDDIISTVSSITRATSVGTAAANHGMRLARSHHAQHIGNFMSGDGEMIPSTIGGTPPPLPIGAFYEQSQRRSRTTEDSVDGSSHGSSSGNKRSSHDKQGNISASSSGGAAKMPATLPSPRRPCQEKTGVSVPLTPNRPCSNKQVANDMTAGNGGILSSPTTADGQSALENDDVESSHFFADTLAVARLVSPPPQPPPVTATTVSTSLQTYSHFLQHEPHMPQQQRSTAVEAAREEFRRQVRTELLQETVRAEPVSSSLTSQRQSTTTTVQPMRTSAKRMSHFRTKVVAFGILLLLAVVAVAVSVGASVGRKNEQSTTTSASGDIESSSATATAPPQAIVYLDDGRQAFTSTQQLYDAVDDYLQTNQDDNEDENTVNSSMTAAALTYGYPIGTWDVSRISDFSLVLCPNRDMKMDLGARFAAYSSFNEDLSGWNVSNAITMYGMFAGCKDLVGEGIDNWDTSRVADFSFLLLGAKAFVGNVSAWNTSSATIMKSMFSGAEKYNGDLSTFNLTKVHSTARMFSRAFAFEGRGLSEWNVAHVRDMNCMFCRATVFNGSISAWDTSHVEDMANMFHTAETFNGDLSSWQVGRVSTLECMFAVSESFQGFGLSNWNTSRVTSLKQTFAFSAFDANLSRWDVGLVNDFTESFKNAKSFKGGDLSRWNTSSAQDMNAMFLEATSFSSDLSSWNVAQVEDLELMFAGASSFNYSLCSWGPQLPSTANVQGMFDGSAACETQSEPSALNLSFGPFCQFCE